MEFKKHIFLQHERRYFLLILKKYKNVIESKETGGSILKIKNEAWDNITMEFNSSPHTTRPATCKQLRRLWMNMKQRKKEAMRRERQERLAPGGGQSTEDEKIVPDIEYSDSFCLATQLKSDESSRSSQPIPNIIILPSSEPHTLMQTTDTDDLELSTSTSNTIKNNMDLRRASRVANGQYHFESPETNIKEKEYEDCLKMQSERHKKEQVLLDYETREAKAKSDLAELILEAEYRERRRRESELHEMQKRILDLKIKEAKAKAELAELILYQHRSAMSNGQE